MKKMTMGSLGASMGLLGAIGTMAMAPTASAGENPVVNVDTKTMAAKYQISAPAAGYSDAFSCESAVNGFYKTTDMTDTTSSTVATSLLNINSGWDTMCFKLPNGKYSWGRVGFNLKDGVVVPSWLAAYKPTAGGSIANAKLHYSYNYVSIDSCISTKASVIAGIESHGGDVISSQPCVYNAKTNTYTYGGLSYVTANGYKVTSSDPSIPNAPFAVVAVMRQY